MTDAPEPLRSALLESFPSEKSFRLLVHAPAFFSTVGEKTPATVLAVTIDGWLIASEIEDSGARVEKSDFGETLFLELTSILLYGQFKIYYATVGTAYSATVRFDTVGEEFYREAIDLILKTMDQTRAPEVQNDRVSASIFETWPMKIPHRDRALPTQRAALMRRHALARCFRRIPPRARSRWRTLGHGA